MIYKPRNNILHKIIAIGTLCLFLTNQLIWAYPTDALAPKAGNPETFQEVLDKMWDELDTRHQTDIDEIIERYGKANEAKILPEVKYYSYGLEQNFQDYFENAIEACGAENMLTRLYFALLEEKEGGSHGRGAIQIIFVDSEDDLPEFKETPNSKPKKVWGHAGRYVTVFALRDEQNTEEGRRRILGRLFHEIRARSRRAKELLEGRDPATREEVYALKEEFERDNLTIQTQVEETGTITDERLKKEFIHLGFDYHPAKELRDYTADQHLERRISYAPAYKAPSRAKRRKKTEELMDKKKKAREEKHQDVKRRKARQKVEKGKKERRRRKEEKRKARKGKPQLHPEELSPEGRSNKLEAISQLGYITDPELIADIIPRLEDLTQDGDPAISMHARRILEILQRRLLIAEQPQPVQPAQEDSGDGTGGIAVLSSGALVGEHRGPDSLNEVIAKCLEERVGWLRQQGKITPNEAAGFIDAIKRGEKRSVLIEKLAIGYRPARSRKDDKLLAVVPFPVKNFGYTPDGRPITSHIGLTRGVIWVATGTNEEPRTEEEIELDCMHELEEYNQCYLEAESRRWKIGDIAIWRDSNADDLAVQRFFHRTHKMAWDSVADECDAEIYKLEHSYGVTDKEEIIAKYRGMAERARHLAGISTIPTTAQPARRRGIAQTSTGEPSSENYIKVNFFGTIVTIPLAPETLQRMPTLKDVLPLITRRFGDVTIDAIREGRFIIAIEGEERTQASLIHPQDELIILSSDPDIEHTIMAQDTPRHLGEWYSDDNTLRLIEITAACLQEEQRLPSSLEDYAREVAREEGIDIPLDVNWDDIETLVLRGAMLSPDELRSAVMEGLRQDREYLREVPLAIEMQEEFPGTVEMRDLDNIKRRTYITEIPTIDSARRLRGSPHRKIRGPSRREGSFARLSQVVEAPAQPLIDRILRIGGEPFTSNAYGPGLRGVWWTRGEVEYFTPLTIAGYEEVGDFPATSESQEDGTGGTAVSSSGALVGMHRGEGKLNDNIEEILLGNLDYYGITKQEAELFKKWHASDKRKSGKHAPIFMRLPIEKLTDGKLSAEMVARNHRKLKVVPLPVDRISETKEGEPITAHIGFREGIIWVAVGTGEHPRSGEEIELDCVHELQEYNIAEFGGKDLAKNMTQMAEWRDEASANAQEFFCEAHQVAWEWTMEWCERKILEAVRKDDREKRNKYKHMLEKAEGPLEKAKDAFAKFKPKENPEGGIAQTSTGESSQDAWREAEIDEAIEDALLPKPPHIAKINNIRIWKRLQQKIGMEGIYTIGYTVDIAAVEAGQWEGPGAYWDTRADLERYIAQPEFRWKVFVYAPFDNGCIEYHERMHYAMFLRGLELGTFISRKDGRDVLYDAGTESKDVCRLRDIANRYPDTRKRFAELEAALRQYPPAELSQELFTWLRSVEEYPEYIGQPEVEPGTEEAEYLEEYMKQAEGTTTIMLGPAKRFMRAAKEVPEVMAVLREYYVNLQVAVNKVADLPGIAVELEKPDEIKTAVVAPITLEERQANAAAEVIQENQSLIENGCSEDVRRILLEVVQDKDIQKDARRAEELVPYLNASEALPRAQEMIEDARRKIEMDSDSGLGVTQSKAGILPHRREGNVNYNIIEILGKNLRIIAKAGNIKRGEYAAFEGWYKTKGRDPNTDVPQDKWLPIEKLATDYIDIGSAQRPTRLWIVELPVDELGEVRGEPFTAHVGFTERKGKREAVMWVAANRDRSDVELDIMHEEEEFLQAFEGMRNFSFRNMQEMAEWRDDANDEAVRFFRRAHVLAWENVVERCKDECVEEAAVVPFNDEIKKKHVAELRRKRRKLEKAEEYLADAKVAKRIRPSSLEGIAVVARKKRTNGRRSPLKIKQEVSSNIDSLSVQELLKHILNPREENTRSIKESIELANLLEERFTSGRQRKTPPPTELEEKAFRLVRDSMREEWDQIHQARSMEIRGELKTLTYPKVAQKQTSSCLFLVASTVLRALEGLRSDENAPHVETPNFIDETLPMEGYLRILRQMYINENITADYRRPAGWPIIGFRSFEEHQREDINSPIGIKPFLAARCAGIEPVIRSFPDLAAQFATDTVIKTEYIQPTANNPSGLAIHFNGSIKNSKGERDVNSLAVFLLEKDWGPFSSGDTDKDLRCVEFDEDKVRALVFQEDSPPEEKLRKIEALFNLAMDNKLVARAGYEIYSFEGVRQAGEFFGRTPDEAEAIYYQLRAQVDNNLWRWREGPKEQRPIEATEVTKRTLTRRFKSQKAEIIAALSAAGNKTGTDVESGAEVVIGEDLETQIAQVVDDLKKRTRNRAHQRDFPPSQYGESDAFIARLVRRILTDGKDMRFSDLRKAWRQEQKLRPQVEAALAKASESLSNAAEQENISAVLQQMQQSNEELSGLLAKVTVTSTFHSGLQTTQGNLQTAYDVLEVLNDAQNLTENITHEYLDSVRSVLSRMDEVIANLDPDQDAEWIGSIEEAGFELAANFGEQVGEHVNTCDPQTEGAAAGQLFYQTAEVLSGFPDIAEAHNQFNQAKALQLLNNPGLSGIRNSSKRMVGFLEAVREGVPYEGDVGRIQRGAGELLRQSVDKDERTFYSEVLRIAHITLAQPEGDKSDTAGDTAQADRGALVGVHRTIGGLNEQILERLAEYIGWLVGEGIVSGENADKFMKDMEDGGKEAYLDIDREKCPSMQADNGTSLAVVEIPTKELASIQSGDGKALSIGGHIGLRNGIIWVATDGNNQRVQLTKLHEREEYNVTADPKFVKKHVRSYKELGLIRRDGTVDMERMADWRDGKFGDFNEAQRFFHMVHRDAWRRVARKCKQEAEEIDERLRFTRRAYGAQKLREQKEELIELAKIADGSFVAARVPKTFEYVHESKRGIAQTSSDELPPAGSSPVEVKDRKIPVTWYGPDTAVTQQWKKAYEYVTGKHSSPQGITDSLQHNVNLVLELLQSQMDIEQNAIMLNLACGKAPLNNFENQGVTVVNIDSERSHVRPIPSERASEIGANYTNCDLEELPEHIDRIRSAFKPDGHIQFVGFYSNMIEWLRGYTPLKYGISEKMLQHVNLILKNAWTALEGEQAFLIVTEPGCENYIASIDLFADNLDRIIVIGSEEGNFGDAKAVILCRRAQPIQPNYYARLNQRGQKAVDEVTTGKDYIPDAALDAVRQCLAGAVLGEITPQAAVTTLTQDCKIEIGLADMMIREAKRKATEPLAMAKGPEGNPKVSKGERNVLFEWMRDELKRVGFTVHDFEHVGPNYVPGEAILPTHVMGVVKEAEFDKLEIRVPGEYMKSGVTAYLEGDVAIELVVLEMAHHASHISENDRALLGIRVDRDTHMLEIVYLDDGEEDPQAAEEFGKFHEAAEFAASGRGPQLLSHIAENLRANIGGESEEYQGTRIIFSVPLPTIAYYVELDDRQKGVVDGLHNDLGVRNVLAGVILGRISRENAATALGIHPKVNDVSRAWMLVRETMKRVRGPFAMARDTDDDGFHDMTKGRRRQRVRSEAAERERQKAAYQQNAEDVLRFLRYYRDAARALGGEEEKELLNRPVSIKELHHQLCAFLGFPFREEAFFMALCDIAGPINLYDEKKRKAIVVVSNLLYSEPSTSAAAFAVADGGEATDEDVVGDEMDRREYSVARFMKEHSSLIPQRSGHKAKTQRVAIRDILLDVTRDITYQNDRIAAEALFPHLKEPDMELALAIVRKTPRMSDSYIQLNAGQKEAINRVNEVGDPVVADTLARFTLGGMSKRRTITALTKHLQQSRPELRDVTRAAVAASELVRRLNEPQAMAKRPERRPGEMPQNARHTQPIEALLIDVDGTLYTVSPELHAEIDRILYETFARMMGMRIEEAKEIFDARQRELNTHDEGAVYIDFGFDLRVVDEERSKIDINRYSKRNEELIACLRRLKEKYRLVAGSNGGSLRIQKFMEELGLSDIFEKVFTQEDLGVRKPDPAFFGAVLEYLGLRPEQVASIGDHAALDTEPAQAMGMEGLSVSGPDELVGTLETRLAELQPAQPNSYLQLDNSRQEAIDRVNESRDPIVANTLAHFMLGGVSREQTINVLAARIEEIHPELATDMSASVVKAREVVRRLTEPLAMAKRPKESTSFAEMDRRVQHMLKVGGPQVARISDIRLWKHLLKKLGRPSAHIGGFVLNMASIKEEDVPKEDKFKVFIYEPFDNGALTYHELVMHYAMRMRNLELDMQTFERRKGDTLYEASAGTESHHARKLHDIVGESQETLDAFGELVKSLRENSGGDLSQELFAWIGLAREYDDHIGQVAVEPGTEKAEFLEGYRQKTSKVAEAARKFVDAAENCPKVKEFLDKYYAHLVNLPLERMFVSAQITQDVALTARLVHSLIPAESIEGNIYTIKIDADRMSPVQIKIIRDWIDRLRVRYPSCEFKIGTFSSRRAGTENLIAVSAETREHIPIGEGCIQAPQVEDRAEEVYQRTIGMLNICFAASNVPSQLEGNVSADLAIMKLINFIRDQYWAITGRALTIAHYTPEAINDAIREIEIIQKPAKRIDFKEQEEFEMSQRILDRAA